jgi:hypothetical protein
MPSLVHEIAVRLARAAAVGALMLSPGTARAQFSPGPLSSSHAAIDHPTACLECHEPKRATTAVRCLACHQPLGTRIAAQQGYHGRDPARSTQCASCHPEHGGREAALVRWTGGREKFDHALTGYVLTGHHAALGCNACHLPALIRAVDVRQAKDLKLRTTYLGLSTRCADCHGDVHRGQFAAEIQSRDCAPCHSTDRWDEVIMDHAETRFPLTGKHAAVACQKCHFSENDAAERVIAGSENSFVRFKPLAHGACADCHTDVHKGRFGADCTRCHTTAGWTSITTGAFDHDKTPYPLRGMHRTVDCAKCHTSGEFKKRIAFAQCSDCHQDRHTGQLAKSPSRGLCEACHSVEEFSPARFGTLEHQKTSFPLRGAHLAVACNACHKLTAAGAPAGSVRFRLRSAACTDCHTDEHAGQFSKAPGGTDCIRCHLESSWRIASFNHSKTRFPLDGAHAKATCSACHLNVTIGDRKTVRYRPLDTACRACHATEPRSGGKRSTT